MSKMNYVLGSLFAVSTVLAVADQTEPAVLESAVTVPTSVVTPSVAPVVDGAGFFFTADFISGREKTRSFRAEMNRAI